MYMLDTNICIYILNHHPENLLQKFNSNIDSLSISSIVYSELYYGVENTQSKNLKEERKNQLLEFVSLLVIEPWGENAAEIYGKLRAYLKNKGQMIPNMDLLIAAHAIGKSNVLVTNNERDFLHIPGIKIENWFK